MRRTQFLSSFSKWAPIIVSGGAMGALVAGTISASTLLAACGSDDTSTGSGDDTNTTGYTPDAGTFPPASYIPPAESNQCGAAETSCSMNGTNCGATSACAAIATNTGTTANFRLRGLYLAEPSALTDNTVQGAIVNTGLELTAPTCGENGTALFNWLLTFDLSAMTMKTGAAPVPTDPSGQSGFCYENGTEGAYTVVPETTSITKGSDGTYSSGVIPSLNVLFGTVDGNVVLPLRNLQLKNITLSENNDCIGSLNKSGIDNSCADVDGCNRWNTAGSLGSYITLADADKVTVVQLSESLCSLLTAKQGIAKTADGLCGKDSSGKIQAVGDYCSTTNSPGGCNDSFWMGATFSASAVKVTDGTGVDKCTTGAATTSDAGGMTVDSGTTSSDGGDAGN